MPAEWDRHRATWLAWPHERSDWPGKFPTIPWVIAEVARQLVRCERVRLIVQDRSAEQQARRALGKVGADLDSVDFYRIPTDRSWLRDTGPIFVRDRVGRLMATTWRFNAWAKYANWKRDVKVAAKAASAVDVPTYEPRYQGQPVVLEGGAIDVDGEGTLLATEECLLSSVQARNPGLGREEVERLLRETLGVESVVWLGRGIAGDDTHGHIDDLARFVAPGRLLLCSESDRRDANYEALEENRERLEGARDARGRKLQVIPLPMPAPLYFEGQRLPASYANFYIASDRVLMPTFNDPNDRVALGLLGELFPGREIVGIHAVDLVWGLGTLHCMTQQEPLPQP